MTIPSPSNQATESSPQRSGSRPNADSTVVSTRGPTAQTPPSLHVMIRANRGSPTHNSKRLSAVTNSAPRAGVARGASGGVESCQVSFAVRTRRVLPSAPQAIVVTRPASSGSGSVRSAPLSRFIRTISPGVVAAVSRARSKATASPRGLMRGIDSWSAVKVSWAIVPPLAGTTKRSVFPSVPSPTKTTIASSPTLIRFFSGERLQAAATTPSVRTAAVRRVSGITSARVAG